MDENEELKDAVRKCKEERIKERVEQLEKSLVKSAEIVTEEVSIDVPNSLSDEGVYIKLDGGRCAIVSYKKHYFLYDKSAKKFFSPCFTCEDAMKEYLNVEGNRG